MSDAVLASWNDGKAKVRIPGVFVHPFQLISFTDS
jgi:hypothetical protein